MRASCLLNRLHSKLKANQKSKGPHTVQLLFCFKAHTVRFEGLSKADAPSPSKEKEHRLFRIRLALSFPRR